MTRISSYIVAIALFSACAGGTGGTGSEGPAGPEGPQGPAGAVGPKGQTGAVGSQGPAGTTGPAGALGPQGPAGTQGPAGATGALGPQGLLGARGVQGLQGVAGPVGAQGPAGGQGAVGLVGGRGDPGPAGPPGQLFVPATGATATLVAGSVTTADTDSTRLVTGTSDACGSSCVVADGPFVLTDARSVDPSNITWLVQVDAGADCAAVCTSPGSLPPRIGTPLVGLTANATVRGGAISFSDHLSGARFAVAAGKRLCACATSIGLSGFSPAWKAWWTGFVPYQ